MNMCAISLLTFFALQCNPGLQVVHLHLQPFEREVVFSRFAFVGDEDEDHNDEEKATTCCDAHDGGQSQETV